MPPPQAPLVNPNLSANLAADYEALQNDMQQAKELAADFQRQLAGKSNEFAQLKQLFEKTSADLAQLQSGIVELRAERHRLANESMRATAFQLKLSQVTAERDRLRVDLEHVRKALDQSAGGVTAAVKERDNQIAALVVELVTVKEALESARRELQAAHGNGAPPRRNGEGVMAGAGGSKGSARQPEKIELGDEFIDISFGA
jgi:septal ring factor EnvC (AmiA/AmiB activator)